MKIYDKPFHVDECGHGDGCYVGSFKYYTNADKEMKIDIYIYEQPGERQEVCLRYGSEGPEYMSHGPLWQFIRTSHIFPKYHKALDLMRKKGSIKWERLK